MAGLFDSHFCVGDWGAGGAGDDNLAVSLSRLLDSSLGAGDQRLIGWGSGGGLHQGQKPKPAPGHLKGEQYRIPLLKIVSHVFPETIRQRDHLGMIQVKFMVSRSRKKGMRTSLLTSHRADVPPCDHHVVNEHVLITW